MDSARVAAKHVLRYLKGLASRGICFSSDGDHGELTAFYQCPIACTGKALACCDANWGPQDASNPTETTKHDRMTIDECRSLQGILVVRMGGAVAWKGCQEKRVSRSSCKSEIHAN
jgi:hypothetical protein